jgi:50S ribosomal subunit-associated GTPase HflX
VIVVDLSQPSSMQSIDGWIEQIFSRTDIEEPTIMVLANKRDLDPSKRQISSNQIEEFQRKHTTILFFEVSARTGHNVKDAFIEISESMMSKG